MSDSDLVAELDATESKDVSKEDPKEDPKEESKEEKSEPTVPVSVLTAEREEGRKRAAAWEDIARAKTTSELPTVEPIDYLTDTSENIDQRINQKIDQKVRQATEGLSKSYAMRQHGKKVLDEAHAALGLHGTPTEQQALAASADPWGGVVEWRKRRVVLAEIGDDPVAWRKAETERIKTELLAQATVRQAKGLDPAPTLADEPNLGAREKADVVEEDDLKKLIGE